MLHGRLGDVRVVVVSNPVRDPDGQAVAAAKGACAARGWPAALAEETTVAHPGAAQARRAVEQGAELVIVCGGDGTVREVAGPLAGTGVALGIVPLGTANLFARNLRLPIGNVQRSLEVALDGEPRDLDLGRARWVRRDGQVGEGAFVVVAGIGNDARTIELVRPALKQHLQWLAYFVPALETLAAPLLPMTVQLDDGPSEERLLWCLLAGNVGRIPLGIDVLPGAQPDDGLLHVALVAPPRVLSWAPIALKGLLHWPGDVPGLEYATARTVRVESRTPLTIHVDGDEHGGVVWLEARVEPGALRVRLPAARPRATGRG